MWPETPCYNQLLQYDPKDPDNKIIPDLAESYELSNDGTSIVFKLHPGIKFHDGGEFTSEDIKANLEWIKDPPAKKPSPRSGALSPIDHVETPDPLTAKVVLKQPSPSLIPNLATHYLGIGSKGDLAKGDLGTQMNGTGPFKLKSYTRGVGTELERNPSYWVKDRPYLDGLSFLIVADENTAFTDFLAGRFHRFAQVLPENAGRIARETNGRARTESPPSTLRDELFFNGAKRPYNDIRVRQAVSLVLERASAIQVVQGGKGTPCGYMLPGGRLGDRVRAAQEGCRLRQTGHRRGKEAARGGGGDGAAVGHDADPQRRALSGNGDLDTGHPAEVARLELQDRGQGQRGGHRRRV
jgi:peptide/nickel transport system substrate-binding protein